MTTTETNEIDVATLMDSQIEALEIEVADLSEKQISLARLRAARAALDAPITTGEGNTEQKRRGRPKGVRNGEGKSAVAARESGDAAPVTASESKTGAASSTVARIARIRGQQAATGKGAQTAPVAVKRGRGRPRGVRNGEGKGKGARTA